MRKPFFTLIELMVLVIVIGVLVTIGVPFYKIIVVSHQVAKPPDGDPQLKLKLNCN